MKNFLFLAFVFADAASPGFSQTSGTTSTAASTNTVTATVIAQGGGTQHQLIQAMPGPIPGMFPGSAMNPGVCYVYHPKLSNLKYLTPSEVKSMAKGSKLPHGVKATTIDPDAAKAGSYDGPIGIMEYDPTGNAINDGDIALAGIIIPGKPFQINEALLGVAIKALRKKAPAMQRVAVLNCFIFAEVTDTSSKGIGIMASGTNATGQVGGSGTIGWFHGKSSTEQQRHVVTTVYALNGPYNLLTPPPPPEPKNGDRATAQPAMPAMAQPMPQPAPSVSAPVQPPQPPAPPAPIATALDECLRDAIPNVNVYFAFDHPKPGEGDVFSPVVMTEDGPKDNAAAVHTIQRWLENHPSCKIDVVGYTDHRGSSAYNNDLAERRPDAVVAALKKDEKIRSQVFEADSNGKENASPTGNKEINWWDRRVSFRVRGSDSAGR